MWLATFFSLGPRGLGFWIAGGLERLTAQFFNSILAAVIILWIRALLYSGCLWLILHVTRFLSARSQCIMKKRPASEGRSCDGRSNCNGESGAKEPQKDIGKSAREWHFDLEGKDNR